MSRGDIGIHDRGGLNVVPVRTFPVETGESAIYAGEPVKISSSGNYAVPCVDGDPTGNSDYIVGIAAKDSSQSSSADGYVDVYLNLPNVIWKGKPKVAGNANTQAKIDALTFKRVPLDLTSSKFTVDTAASDAATNGVMIVGGNANKDEVHFQFLPNVSYLKSATL